MSTTPSPVLREGRHRAGWRYLLIGGATFLLDFALLWLLADVLHLPSAWSAAVAFLAITVFNFLGQWRVTFGATSSGQDSLIRYLSLLLVNTLLTAAAVELSERAFGHFAAGKVVISVLIVLWNFPIMNRWVFPERSSPKKAGG